LGAVVGADAQIRCFFTWWDLTGALEADAVGGFRGILAASIAEPGKLFGAAIIPCLFVRGMEKILVFEELSSGFVKDCIEDRRGGRSLVAQIWTACTGRAS